MKLIYSQSLLALAVVLSSCGSDPQPKAPKEDAIVETPSNDNLVVRFDAKMLDEGEFKAFNTTVPQTGRYEVTVYGESKMKASVWVEDYVTNEDARTYNITGTMAIGAEGTTTIDGSPLGKGEHQMKVHATGKVRIDSITFTLMIPQQATPEFLKQKMDGEEWNLVWSDEFEGKGLPDPTKWSYNVGNWGWGNNELQYYTDGRLENARQESGNLIIEAHKNEQGNGWTSARLSTQGLTSFTYGKIEFRAKVPAGRGCWAAGWLLGDAYQDEISWPYCGEIDVLECVGFEIDDATGSGLNHATCHTRAYYFKQGNQIGSEIAIENMNSEFHTYAVEWFPDVIHGYLDGVHYYTYDKTADELEWPFDTPQNIIVNLAIGGGWGGAKGVDESHDSHQYIIDYVRVYEKK